MEELDKNRMIYYSSKFGRLSLNLIFPRTDEQIKQEINEFISLTKELEKEFGHIDRFEELKESLLYHGEQVYNHYTSKNLARQIYTTKAFNYSGLLIKFTFTKIEIVALALTRTANNYKLNQVVCIK